MATMKTLTKHQKKDIKLIGRFVEVYCAGHHSTTGWGSFPLPAQLGELRICSECARIMEYAVNKRLKCPLENEKPSCKRCRIHCYAPAEREKIREIMAYSGRRMIMRGRLDYVWHYVV